MDQNIYQNVHSITTCISVAAELTLGASLLLFDVNTDGLCLILLAHTIIPYLYSNNIQILSFETH